MTEIRSNARSNPSIWKMAEYLWKRYDIRQAWYTFETQTTQTRNRYYDDAVFILKRIKLPGVWDGVRPTINFPHV